jgi:peptidoglycan/xylan/chitin deacetylase (PgdA/CDA1 family)
MMTSTQRQTRRTFLSGALAGGAALAGAREAPATQAADDRALVAITLDLEMSRHYPTWDQMHWDYEKGNLDQDTKRYAAEAARRVKAGGGRIHFFAVGRVFEQEDIGWLQEIVREGHPVGNHTYDHVNVHAQKPDDIQFRFKRAPWLIEGKSTGQVIEDNIRLCSLAMKQRLGIDPIGFRTPGGFNAGLTDRADLQQMLQKLGFDWVSSQYPAHPIPVGEPESVPSKDVLDAVVDAQAKAQPFVYPSGLIEVPMNPISDVGAFRTGRWKREAFLEALRRGVGWAIEHRAVFDFLAHPSCLVVADPDFQAIELVCELVRQAGDRAALVDLRTVAGRAKQRALRQG